MPATKRLIESRAAAKCEDAPLRAALASLAAERDADESGDMEAMAEREEAVGRLRHALRWQAYERASRSY